MWWLNNQISFLEKTLVIQFFACYGFLLFGSPLLTPAHWEVIGLITTVLSIVSKVPQIILNFKNKATGQLSLLTVFMQMTGSIAGMATVLFEALGDDNVFWKQFSIMPSVLSVILML